LPLQSGSAHSSDRRSSSQILKCLSSATACLPTSYLSDTNFDTHAYNIHKLSERNVINGSVSQSTGRFLRRIPYKVDTYTTGVPTIVNEIVFIHEQQKQRRRHKAICSRVTVTDVRMAGFHCAAIQSDSHRATPINECD